MEQEQLVRQLRQGDSNALRGLMALYTPYLCTVAANLAVPPLTAQDVEEIVSDAFIRLWRHRQDLDPERSLKGYLVRITRNLVVDTLRSRKTDCLPLVDEILEQETPLETRLEQQEAVRRLKTHLEGFPLWTGSCCSAFIITTSVPPPSPGNSKPAPAQCGCACFGCGRN